MLYICVCVAVTNELAWFVGNGATHCFLYRDKTPCNDSDVESRRELFEKIFATLEAAG